MLSALEKSTKRDVQSEPFPYLVVEDALPQNIADELLATYPSLNLLGGGVQGLVKNGIVPNNEKLRYYSFEVLKDHNIPDIWKDFVKTHLSYDFYKIFFHLFEDEIARFYPNLLPNLKSFTPKDIGMRKFDSFDDKKMLLDAEICVDTPVKFTSSVKPAHIDGMRKLAVMLYYLKKPDDDSVGGDFEISSLEKGPLVLNQDRIVQSGQLKKENIIPYRHNTALIFLNTKDSLHGVSPRQPTNHLRYSFDVAFELPNALFDLTPNICVPITTRVRRKLGKIARSILK